jgi:hypothetical protein
MNYNNKEKTDDHATNMLDLSHELNLDELTQEDKFYLI